VIRPRIALVLAAIPVFAIAAACGDDPPGAASTPEEAGSPDPAFDGGGSDANGHDAGPPNYDPTGRSGTRLRRRYIESGPGAYRTLDFWDSEMQTVCVFSTAADGELRCLPRGLDFVYYVGATCTGTELVMVPGSGRCGNVFGKTTGRPNIFRRTTTKKTLSDGVYSSVVNVTCSANTGAPGLEVDVIEEIPSVRFVAGTTIDEPRAGGMVARFVDGADGSRVLLSAIDTARNTTCDFSREPGRCLPPRVEPISYFSNNLCTLPVAAVFGTAPPDLLRHALISGEGCPISNDYYAVGAALAPGAPIWRRDDTGTCLSATPSSTNRYYARGAQVPLTSFPAAKVKHEGTGAIQARRFFDADDKPLGVAHAFWDVMADREGVAAKVGDGSLRFLPRGTGVFSANFFAEAACNTAPLGIQECEANPVPWIVRVADDYTCFLGDYVSCQNVYPAGAEHLGDLYILSGGAPCQPRARQRGQRYYSLGAAAPPSAFPELFLRTE
jgi:hypothetical protein